MEKIKFSAMINASREKLWQTLWNDETYRRWTSVFAEGSYAVTDWQEGSKVLFLTPAGNGMVSRIEKVRDAEFISFEHLGTVKEGIEDTTSDAVKQWAGAHENYTLSVHGDGTILDVEMDTTADFKEYFMQTWPKALNELKIIAEQNN